ncbi:MAG TPA: cupin-like domain-containing protein [Methylibium sp.]
MHAAAQAIPEYAGLDETSIRRDILTQYRPAILRGLVRDWPAVREAAVSAAALSSYLKALDSGREVDAIMTPPEERGRIFYNADLSGFNFLRNRLPLSKVIEQVLRYSLFDRPPSVAAQSALIPDCLPGFVEENRLGLLDAAVQPRIWLGNAITTPAHFDEADNIACVVSGRRRFTLFSPEQIANLYVGPLDYTPTNTPISLVDFEAPDFERHPRFRKALAAAHVGELGPGDAIFIPTLWWHHVVSLEKFNVLVNYWWNGSIGTAGRTDSGLAGLLHSLLNLRQLSSPQRQAWSAIFEHYLFGDREAAAAHIPPHLRGVLGEMSDEQVARLRALLRSGLEG